MECIPFFTRILLFRPKRGSKSWIEFEIRICLNTHIYSKVCFVAVIVNIGAAERNMRRYMSVCRTHTCTRMCEYMRQTTDDRLIELLLCLTVFLSAAHMLPLWPIRKRLNCIYAHSLTFSTELRNNFSTLANI